MRKNRYQKLNLGSKKTLFEKLSVTVLLIFLFQLLSFVPAPFVNPSALKEITENLNVFQTAQLFTGNAFARLTLMATGISSYITASIILQLLTYSSKKLNEISKSSNGQAWMKKATIVLGVILSLFTSLVMTTLFSKKNPSILTNHSWYVFLLIALFHIFGTIIAILIGEAIDKKGYGNGLSLLIAVNVAVSVPMMAEGIFHLFKRNVLYGSVSFLLTLSMVLLVILVDSSVKNIPVSYSKIAARNAGRTVTQKQVLPIKVNGSGVMPIILASTILQVALFIIGFVKNSTVQKIAKVISDPGQIYFGVLMAALIVLFTFFYASISFNPTDIADNLQQSGGVILGVRPGKETKEYLRKTSRSLTRVSAFYLFVISLIPTAMQLLFQFSAVHATSVMILVGVGLETLSKLANEYALGKMKL